MCTETNFLLVDYDKTIVLATAFSVCTLTRTQGPTSTADQIIRSIANMSDHHLLIVTSWISEILDLACVQVYTEDSLYTAGGQGGGGSSGEVSRLDRNDANRLFSVKYRSVYTCTSLSEKTAIRLNDLYQRNKLMACSVTLDCWEAGYG